MTTHEVLCAAKVYLLTHGWLQMSPGEHGGPRCAAGAITATIRNRGAGLEACDGADKALLAAVGDYPLVAFWNDMPGRTFDDVIDAFDRAIMATAPREPLPSLTSPDPVPA